MNKKQFFLSMSKKQLISSVAVMSMLMSSTPVNVHAISNSINPNNQSQSTSIDGKFDEILESKDISTNEIQQEEVHIIKGYKDLRIDAPSAQPQIVGAEKFNNTYKPQGGSEEHKYPVVKIKNKDTNDIFVVNVSRYGTDEEFKKADDYVKYNVDVQVKGNNKLKVTITTEPGAYIGKVDSCYKNVLVKPYTDGKTTYEFTYDLYNGSGGGEHPIDIVLAKGQVVSNAEGFINALKDRSVDNIVLSKNIKFTKEDIEKLKIDSKDPIKLDYTSGLRINRSVNIDGTGHFIDFGTGGAITLTKGNSKLKNITIQNYVGTGLQVYKAKNVTLDGVHIIGDDSNNSKNGIYVNGCNGGVSINNCSSQKNRYGIIINGSKVSINNCSTDQNKLYGIYVYRDKKDYVDSDVTIDNISEIKDKNTIVIKNLAIESNFADDFDKTQQNTVSINGSKDITEMDEVELKTIGLKLNPNVQQKGYKQYKFSKVK